MPVTNYASAPAPARASKPETAVPNYSRQLTQFKKTAKDQSQNTYVQQKKNNHTIEKYETDEKNQDQNIYVQHQQKKDDHTIEKYEADEKNQNQNTYVQQKKDDHTIENYEANEKKK